MNQQEPPDDPLLPVSSILIFYSFCLNWIVDQYRRAGKIWTQTEIYNATGISVTTLQEIIGARRLANGKQRFILATVFNFPQLLNLPQLLESTKGIMGRSEYEIGCIPGFYACRDSVVQERIRGIAYGYDHAANRISKSLAEQDMHLLLADHHDDPMVKNYLYTWLRQGIQFMADWAPFLGIEQFCHRPKEHTLLHQKFIRACLSGSINDIMHYLIKHRDFVAGDRRTLQNFVQTNYRAGSWGFAELGTSKAKSDKNKSDKAPSKLYVRSF